MHGKTTKIITAITSASATRYAGRLGRNRHGFGLPSHIDADKLFKSISIHEGMAYCAK